MSKQRESRRVQAGELLTGDQRDAASMEASTGGLGELQAVFGRSPDPAEVADVLLERLLVEARPDR